MFKKVGECWSQLLISRSLEQLGGWLTEGVQNLKDPNLKVWFKSTSASQPQSHLNRPKGLIKMDYLHTDFGQSRGTARCYKHSTSRQASGPWVVSWGYAKSRVSSNTKDPVGDAGLRGNRKDRSSRTFSIPLSSICGSRINDTNNLGNGMEWVFSLQTTCIYNPLQMWLLMLL